MRVDREAEVFVRDGLLGLVARRRGALETAIMSQPCRSTPGDQRRESYRRVLGVDLARDEL